MSVTAGELHWLDATALAAGIRTGSVGVAETMRATLARIAAVNPRINAICTLRDEADLLAEAAAADAALARGATAGPLFGLPIAVKDLAATRGLRTTMGSPVFAAQVPLEDQLFVERLRAAGALIIGKTNVPEFGAGSHTFNPLFGPTRNPYDPSRSAGGSSGGAAAALASGMLSLADGSDLGGSLRNPASFCNVVGFRPSPGRVPGWPAFNAWDSLAVEGPMARTVGDCALLLSVMAGPDPRAPLALAEPGADFRDLVDRDWRGTRVAWTPDLGGYPVEREVREVCAAALPALAGLGCEIAQDCPDLCGADAIFQTLRAAAMAAKLEVVFRQHRDAMKETVIWNIERGLALTALDVGRAEAARTQLYHRVRRFFEDYDFLVLPVAQVAPFPVEWDWVREIEGVRLPTYIDWMATCYAITVTGCPAISMPAGFTAGGLPVGLQIVGPHRADLALLRFARAFEAATGHARRRPAL